MGCQVPERRQGLHLGGLWGTQGWGGWDMGSPVAHWTCRLHLAQLGVRGLAQGTAGSLGSWWPRSRFEPRAQAPRSVPPSMLPVSFFVLMSDAPSPQAPGARLREPGCPSVLSSCPPAPFLSECCLEGLRLSADGTAMVHSGAWDLLGPWGPRTPGSWTFCLGPP